MSEVWRIVKARYAKSAFDGEGARRFGGRWNSPGTAMVYCPSSPALAALEILVHLEDSRALRGWVLVRVSFDAALARAVDLEALPVDWRSDPAPAALREIGDRWVREGTSAVLSVPSVLVPHDWNFLVNPGHAGFRKLRIGDAEPFRFDARLMRRRH